MRHESSLSLSSSTWVWSLLSSSSLQLHVVNLAVGIQYPALSDHYAGSNVLLKKETVNFDEEIRDFATKWKTNSKAIQHTYCEYGHFLGLHKFTAGVESMGFQFRTTVALNFYKTRGRWCSYKIDCLCVVGDNSYLVFRCNMGFMSRHKGFEGDWKVSFENTNIWTRYPGHTTDRCTDHTQQSEKERNGMANSIGMKEKRHHLPNERKLTK